MDDEDNTDFRPRLLSNQSGAIIRVIDPGVVQKRGDRVTRSEEAALFFVKEYTKVPLPELYAADYFFKDGKEHGIFLMSLVDGSPLHVVWDGFDNSTKERICHELWGTVRQLRQIPRPPALGHLYQCLADGSPSSDVLLEDLNQPPSPILSDDDLQARIYKRYLHHNGGSFPENLPSILPHSSKSVFTHGDLTPRNIIVDSAGRITGIVDWENAGWYPDYWEYANMMKPSNDDDWMAWMDSTKPQEWDITGIMKARRVLF
ncbi:hypothetical protein ACRALDRAFT_2100321 [Sodiomyces alcalophilus JCM 7366]|uniref:uncharacterized protein n=1 Tax=Sodiomyces alcalophilus JCM 7366 TaxID=591952 RepID=UPI0039B67462